MIHNDASANNSTYLKEKGNVEEGLSYAGREKEKAENGKINTEEHSTVVETRTGQEEKGFQLAPIGPVSAISPEDRKVDDSLTTPPMEEKGSVFLYSV